MSTMTWPQYLQGYNIPPDPFSRSQWESTLSKTRQRSRLPKIGLQMQYQVSDDVRWLLRAGVEWVRRWRFGKNHCQVTTISSLPGGGKTRFLAELFNLLEDSEIGALYYVTFSSSAGLLHKDFDNMDTEESASTSIAMRILYEAVQAHSNTDQDSKDFASWISHVRNLGLADMNNIKQAISLLGGDPRQKCIIAVDDVNKLKEDFTNTGLQSKEASHVAMKNLFKALFYPMMYSQIFSFVAGTLDNDFVSAARSGGIHLYATTLSILSRAQQYAILDAYPGLTGWRRSAKLKKILATLGGLPRLVEILIEQIESALNGTIDFDNINWTQVELSLGQATSAYDWKGGSVEVARRLVDLIMLRKSVLPFLRISPEDPEETFEKLVQHSQIVLQPREESWYPTMPLFAFRTLVKKAKSGDGDRDRFEKLDSLLDHMNIQDWREFEIFASKYSNVMNGFVAQFSDDASSISGRYTGKYGDIEKLFITFLKSHPDWNRCSAHFPTTLEIISQDCDGSCSFTSGDYYLNAPQAGSADGFYVCRIPGLWSRFYHSDDIISDETSDSYKQPRPSLVLVVEQMKQWTSRTLHRQACIDEHKKNMEAFKNIPERAKYRLVTVIIATCRIPFLEDFSGLDDIIVLDITKFEEYFGILAPLVTLGCGRLDINTVTVQDLEKALGSTNTAAKIVEERRKGVFEDKAALQERMSDIGISLEQWKDDIDDWDF